MGKHTLGPQNCLPSHYLAANEFVDLLNADCAPSPLSLLAQCLKACCLVLGFEGESLPGRKILRNPQHAKRFRRSSGLLVNGFVVRCHAMSGSVVEDTEDMLDLIICWV